MNKRRQVEANGKDNLIVIRKRQPRTTTSFITRSTAKENTSSLNRVHANELNPGLNDLSDNILRYKNCKKRIYLLIC